MVIRYYTRPEWEYYQSASTTAQIKLTLGIGGGGSLSCDNNTQGCTLSGNVELGAGGSVLGFDLETSFGLGGEWDIATGSVRVGGTASAGPCDVFAGFTKISIGCTNPLTMHTFELGWTRDALPEVYWVLTRSSTLGSLSYEDFAENRLHFHGNSKIYYQVEARNYSRWEIGLQYLGHPRLYVFE